MLRAISIPGQSPGKHAILISLLLLGSILVDGQNILKVSGNSMKVTGTTNVILKNTDLINQGVFNSLGSATISFTGNNSNTIEAGGANISNLRIAKAANKKVQLQDDLLITNQLVFAADDNTLELGNADLILSNTASITGYTSNKYVVTNGEGSLVKNGLSTFTFPVGFDAFTYNPLSLTASGATDDIGVRCMAQVLEDGGTGLPIVAGAVATCWDLSEAVSGGSTFGVSAQWSLSDELTDFDNADCGIMQYQDGDWDLPVTEMGSATGTDPFTRTGTINGVGIIAVGGSPFINRVRLAPRVFFQGPYAGTQMTDHLRSKNLIPLSEPFSQLGYLHQGRGGGETIDATVFTVTGEDAITDWVIVELRDKNNAGTVLESFSALLQSDGDIVGLDGVDDVLLPVLDDEYFVAIRHRNHLGIRTPTVLNLEETATQVYDFTSASQQAYGTNPMTEVSTGVWAMRGGNANGDHMVRATGPPSINDYSNLLNYLGGPTNIVFDVYVGEDINMDGNVRVTGPPSINDYAKLLNILGGAITILFEQL